MGHRVHVRDTKDACEGYMYACVEHVFHVEVPAVECMILSNDNFTSPHVEHVRCTHGTHRVHVRDTKDACEGHMCACVEYVFHVEVPSA